MASGVLVVDPNRIPVDHVTIQEAVIKLVTDEAVPVKGARIIATFRSPSTTVHVPSIIELKIFVPIPKSLSKHITNRLLFARDNWTCQYCGRHKRELKAGRWVYVKKGDKRIYLPAEKLSRDHVIPVDSFPGATRAEKLVLANTWDNVTTACTTCNNEKANRSPQDSGMHPMTKPYRPFGVLITVLDLLDEEQLHFVEKYALGTRV